MSFGYRISRLLCKPFRASCLTTEDNKDDNTISRLNNLLNHGDMLMLVKNGHRKADILVFKETLYRGETCRVYNGISVDSGVSSAFKVAPYRCRDQLLEEYMLMRKFDHPNIIKALRFEFGNRNQNVVIRMDLAYNGNLQNWLISNHDIDMEIEQLNTWMKELVIAVNHVHSKGYIHGNISCENILLTSKLSIRLSDFGSTMRKEVFKLSKYNRDYMPPELFIHLKEEIHVPHGYDTRAIDAWSVGVVLYNALKRDLNFYEMVSLSKVSMYIMRPVTSLLSEDGVSRCSPQYEAVLSQLLEFNPRRRTVQLSNVINDFTETGVRHST